MNSLEERYLIKVQREHVVWKKKISKNPSIINKVTKGIQHKINDIIPDKVHQIITSTIKEITKAVLFGAGFTTGKPKAYNSFFELETQIEKRITFYSSSSAAEGAITGYGGFISSLADFPLWLTLKMKMLFEIGRTYGYDLSDYKERLFLLYIFQLTFSSQQHRNQIFEIISNWELKKDNLPSSHKDFDWRTFQLEYRDFIDLAKLIQLIPGFGAVAGAYVNHYYTKKLGKNAMNAFRLRLKAFKKQNLIG